MSIQANKFSLCAQGSGKNWVEANNMKLSGLFAINNDNSRYCFNCRYFGRIE